MAVHISEEDAERIRQGAANSGARVEEEPKEEKPPQPPRPPPPPSSTPPASTAPTTPTAKPQATPRPAAPARATVRRHAGVSDNQGAVTVAFLAIGVLMVVRHGWLTRLEKWVQAPPQGVAVTSTAAQATPAGSGFSLPAGVVPNGWPPGSLSPAQKYFQQFGVYPPGTP
jgi:hypothetical protein